MAETMTKANEEILWSWLHISDIHLGHGDAKWRRDQELVLTALREDVPVAIERCGAPKPMDIICTGDVAATGAVYGKHEYDEAAAVFEDLRALCDAPNLFSVQGNHDVRRTPTSERAASRLLRCLREGSEPLDDSYEDPEEIVVHAGRFANYNEFVAGLGAPVGRDGVGAWAEVIERGGLRVEMIGINTSVLCNDDYDERHLRIGRRQLADAFAGRREADLTVVLGHHPPFWLAEEDHDLLQTYLLKGAQLYLHGHIHDPQSQDATAGSGHKLVTISAGAVHGEESEPREHAYSIAALVRLGDGDLGVRVWPRRWSEGRREFLTDSANVPAGEHSTLHRLEQTSRPAGKQPDATPVEQLAVDLVARIGRRRTAFPTDLSIRELYDQDLVIPTRFSASTASEPGAAGVAAALAEGDSVLVLGAAGSGKTMFVYEVAQALAADGALVFAVDLNQIEEVTAASPEALLSYLAGEEVQLAGRESVWLIDGVDELLADRMDPAELGERLERISGFGGLMVSCREFDFRQRLAGSVPDGLFDSVLELGEWRADHEFADFVKRLRVAGRLEDDSLAESVRRDPHLSRLVRRPLLARMLTFVAEDAPLMPSDPSHLYGTYLGKLAETARGSLRRTGCAGIDPAAVWRELAWHVFRFNLRADAVPVEMLLAELGDGDAERECVYRALASILDIGVDPTSTNAGFSHYSFYEYLVAQEVARRLVAANAQSDLDAAVDALAHDLPQEIRRHLVRVLGMSVVDPYGWPRWLAEVYRSAGGAPERRQTVCNLVAYIACRGEAPAAEVLSELAAQEDDPFLRNSLMWALAREGDYDALEEYLADLGANEELAELNRGYLLYYFGDINRGEPPFRDDGTAEWARTRSRLYERFEGAEEYEETPPARQAVDLYTFCDFAVRREERLSSEEDDLIESLLARVELTLPPATVEVLQAARAKVRPK